MQATCMLSWLVYLALFLHGLLRAPEARASVWWCMPSMRLGHPAPVALEAWLPMWLLMSVAMTLPATLPAAQHVATNTFCRRRTTAAAVFLTVFLGAWLAFGLAAEPLLAPLRHTPEDAPFAAAVAVALAAGYQLTPVKRWALNRCHRTSPLPPSGARSIFGVVRFGWLSASGCIASCWAAMLAMLLAPVAQPLVMGTMTVAMTYERLTWRPLTGRRRVAIGYTALAAVFVLATA
jgi:predicted metal-binding membrane protein